jgi:hypothetical protein
MLKQTNEFQQFIISYLKRFQYEFDFMRSVVEQNPKNFDEPNQLANDLERVSYSIGIALEENFDEEVVKATKMRLTEGEAETFPVKD